MYSLFLLTSALSYLALLAALERGSRRAWTLWGLAVLATVATHPYGAIVLASQGLYVALLRAPLRRALLPFAVVAILGIPFWRTDLVLAGRVTEQYRAPFAEQSTESDDHMLDAVERAVVRRPYVGWWRWFRHVRADRLALVGELLADGRWTQESGGLRPSYRNADPGAATALAYATLQVVEKRASPADARQAVLAALTVMCGSVGRPHPRAVRRELKPIIEAAAKSGETGAAILPHVVGGAAVLLRRPLRR